MSKSDKFDEFRNEFFNLESGFSTVARKEKRILTYYETKIEHFEQLLSKRDKRINELESYLEELRKKELDSKYNSDILQVLMKDYMNWVKERELLIASFEKEKNMWSELLQKNNELMNQYLGDVINNSNNNINQIQQ
ncbi:hypothetical protein DFA_06241 [Cavenderia fasciculata]|uniref:Uncharacterized protein n=1 Tax=Cavenderia fasciculata TaxID=261658 RepID=F4PKH8_CACFS|nr:uncharacterized protein DFA_06241 [Cavenderia fasciculata]EGG24102.1 hypothetical protein DFA_06241 [Cavenderia fasciculata]|eukprot:XP_004361953.1 hypothetical protein DFA_06241 [Cavenderia fasciculata]